MFTLMVNFLLAPKVWAYESLTNVQTNPGPVLMSGQWLWLVGGVVVVIALLAVFVVPKMLNYAIGLSVVVFGLLATGLMFPRLMQRSTVSQADLEGTPANIKVDNLGPKQFVISWETGKPVIGAVKYGTDANNLDQIELGFDPTVQKTKHEIGVENLIPGQIYYLKIISGGSDYPEGGPIMITMPK